MHRVEICIQGQLDRQWADWLEGFSISYSPESDTLLRGNVSDQAAFYGIIAKLRDLGVKLIRANFFEDESEGSLDGSSGKGLGGS